MTVAARARVGMTRAAWPDRPGVWRRVSRAPHLLPARHRIDRANPRFYNRSEVVSCMNVTRLSICCLSLLSLAGAGWIAPCGRPTACAKPSTLNPRPRRAKPSPNRSPKTKRKKREEKLRKELETPYKKWLNEDVAYIITDEENAQPSSACRPTKSASSSSSSSGCAAIPPPIRWRTSSRKSITAASRTPTSITPPVSPAGRPTAAASTSPTGRRTKSRRTPRAAAMSGLRKKAAAKRPPIPFEQWRYRYIEGIGTDIIIEFVDPTMSGEYPHDDGPVREGRPAVRAQRRPDPAWSRWACPTRRTASHNTDGTHLADAAGRPAGKHERVHAAGAVRQTAEAARRSSSRIWKRRSLRASRSTSCR